MRPSSRVENVGTCASNRVAWRHPRDWSGGGIVVGERRNAKGYLANKCPPVPQGRVAPPLTWTPNHRLRLQCNVVLMCGCVARILFKILIKTVLFFQKLKGVMKGKGGAGAVAMGKALISNFTPGGFTFVSTS